MTDAAPLAAPTAEASDRHADALRGVRVAVTGGAGFIGSHAVRALLAAGVERVTVIDSLRYGDLANLGELGERVALVRHTLGTDPPEALRPALEGARCVLHLAAEKHNQSKDSPRAVLDANVRGTEELYQAAVAAGVRRVVFSSSLYAYGRLSGPPMVETEVPQPCTVYGVSKLAGEHLLRHHQREHGLSWNVLRYFFVYGPRQFAGMGYKSVILRTCERLAAGEPAVIHGDGAQALDYVFVDDVVAATLRALTLPTDGHTLNVGSGRAVPVAELIATLAALAAERGAHAPPPVHGPADWTAGTCRVADPERAARVLGWRATTSLEEGLARTWARSRGGA